MNFEELIERYGQPLKVLEIIKDRETTIDEDIREKPHKIAIFKNKKNYFGITVCAGFGLKNTRWNINYGKDWAIKYFVENQLNNKDIEFLKFFSLCCWGTDELHIDNLKQFDEFIEKLEET